MNEDEFDWLSAVGFYRGFQPVGIVSMFRLLLASCTTLMAS